MSRKKGSRRSWTKEEKQRLSDRARRELASGRSFSATAQKLGLSENSLRLWLKQYPEAGLQPVEVIEENQREGICLTTPDGFRVEGLDGQTAAELLELLR